MRYVTIDEETVWPVDDGDDSVQWRLRYGNDELVLAVRMQAASVLSAYSALVDPTITQTEAVAKLKRARRAAATEG